MNSQVGVTTNSSATNTMLMKATSRRRIAVKTMSTAGVLLFISFVAASLYVGFADIHVECNRQAMGENPTCSVSETRLWGLVKRSESLQDVSGAAYSTSNAGAGPRVILGTAVVLIARDRSVPLSTVALNVGDRWKAETLKGLRGFLGHPSALRHEARLEERNAFGYIGLLLLSFIGASYVMTAAAKRRARRR